MAREFIMDDADLASLHEELEQEDIELMSDDEGEDEDEKQQVMGWEDWGSDDEAGENLLCLFCESRFDSADDLFDHCTVTHSFDFNGLRKSLGLDFYDSFKLINYVRAQVAENRCWDCGSLLQCRDDLQSHLHAPNTSLDDDKLPWKDDMYLRPFMEDDALLHCFASDEDDDNNPKSLGEDAMMRDAGTSKDVAEFCINSQRIIDFSTPELILKDGTREESDDRGYAGYNLEKSMANGSASEKDLGAHPQKQLEKTLRVSLGKSAARNIKNVNDDYFGSYGSFGIHREMISDKVRMDAYRGALLNNPSLVKQAVVMDVGCGTGILGLFAAQAGASRVIAVEASEKMAKTAAQIARNNGLLAECKGSDGQHAGVITVAHCMVEELEKFVKVQPQSIDVLVSEWMGYCLLYESMLSSVLYARDRWLKPGGAILPDTATMFVAGFGKGGTSLPFWENVYGFDMSCIGKEVVEDAAQVPIVDVISSDDILTESVILQSFDLTTMELDQMDFTENFELKLKAIGDTEGVESGVALCHGVVVWFETGFTSRFCKEMPTLLSTSPYTPKTHWAQSIFTFQEPIAMALHASATDQAAMMSIRCRMSIARSKNHRSIDISLETWGIGFDGQKHRRPVQIFSL